MKCMYVAFPLGPTLTKVFRVHPYVWPTSHALLMQLFIHWTRIYGEPVNNVLGAGEIAVNKTDKSVPLWTKHPDEERLIIHREI